MARARSGRLATALFVIAWLVLAAGIVTVRWELLPLAAGLLMAVGAAVLLSLYGLFTLPVIVYKLLTRKPMASSTLSYCVFGLLPAGVFLYSVGIDGLRAPAIHDITTDRADPPAFRLAAAARSEGDNSSDYEGDVIARIQEKTYPDIEPLVVNAQPAEVLAASQRVAEELGWKVLGVRRDDQIMEAVATSPLFGFEDDIAVRVTGLESGASRVDIRSASRVGLGDLGANARRIRLFSTALAEIL